MIWAECLPEKFQDQKDRTFWSMLNTRGAWRHPLYLHKKAIVVCRDNVDETVMHVLREIMPESVLK